jgi:hypothetical protein
MQQRMGPPRHKGHHAARGLAADKGVRGHLSRVHCAL